VNGASVPASTSPAVARAGPGRPATGGRPSVSAENASEASAAPANCTAVTATGFRPRSSRGWATVNPADSSSEASISRSPAALPPPAPPPIALPPVIRPTPASDSANPAQAAGRAIARCHTAAMTATSTGVAPTSSAAWVTLVLASPAFCSSTEPP
jgi:hypothetical protein